MISIDFLIGFSRQWITNGGKCGICGDPYDSQQVNIITNPKNTGIVAKLNIPGAGGGFAPPLYRKNDKNLKQTFLLLVI